MEEFEFREPGEEPAVEEEKLWENQDLFTPRERRLYMLGALKAGLLIALVFIAGLGALTALLIMLWT